MPLKISIFLGTLNLRQQDGNEGDNIVVKKASTLSFLHVFVLSFEPTFHIHFLQDGFPPEGETRSLFARELAENSLEKKSPLSFHLIVKLKEGRNGKPEYLLKWFNYPEKESNDPEYKKISNIKKFLK